ncbi:MAG: hypothetical protein JWM74_4557 [Myxococcaceae bacterium]|nr:hypothetical protein [Myxococcaceae bacterium]
MVSRSQGLLGLTIVGFSLLAACSLDVQGRQEGRQDDPGQTSTADVIPRQNPTAVDGGVSAIDAAPTSDAAAPAVPAPPKPGVACGTAQCSGAKPDICCINFGGSGGQTSQVCKDTDDCDGARLACDGPSDCPGAVCCLSNALPSPSDPPRTKCDSKSERPKDSPDCDPAVG